MRRFLVCCGLALGLSLGAWSGQAPAGVCGESTGPDLFGASVGDISPILNWGTVGEINGYSFSSNVCNVGDAPLPVEPYTNNHPVFTMNMYRLMNGRFEQIGMSWVKHMWGAATAEYCCSCAAPPDNTVLGVGCSDAYGAGTNGYQQGSSKGYSGLGPRSDVNPVTGVFPFPYTTQGVAGDAIYKRLQVHNDDLNPSLNGSAVYLAEEHFVGPFDSAAHNWYNNVAYRPFQIDGFSDGGYQLSFVEDSRGGVPAITEWAALQPSVTLQNIDVPDDGRFILGYDCTDNGNGTWHYEFALYNMNSNRAAWQFSIPNTPGVIVSNIGFHDVDYHSGEIYDSTDWNATVSSNDVTWSAQPFAENSNANALRWATVYNFRFDANAPPKPVIATIGLFLPGLPTSMATVACGPDVPSVTGDVNGDAVVNVADLVEVINQWGTCPPPPTGCPADLDGSGEVDVTDLLLVITNWS